MEDRMDRKHQIITFIYLTSTFQLPTSKMKSHIKTILLAAILLIEIGFIVYTRIEYQKNFINLLNK